MNGFLSHLQKYKRIKSVLAFVISFAMVLAMLPVDKMVVSASDGSDAFGIFEFQGGTKIEGSNAVSYSIDEKVYIVTLTAVDGTEWGTNNDNAEWRRIPSNTDVKFTLTMPEGEDTVPTMNIGGASEEFALNDGVYSFTRRFDFGGQSFYNIQLQTEGQQEPGRGPEEERTKGAINLICQDLKEAGTVKYRFESDESVEFKEAEDLIVIPSGKTVITIKFEVSDSGTFMLDTGRGVSLYVNGEEKYHQSGEAIEGIEEYIIDLAKCTGDAAIAESIYELSYGFQYVDSSMDQRPRNMLWVYSEEYGQAHHFVDPQGNVDCLVLNGDVDILSIRYDDVVYDREKLLELGSGKSEERGDIWYEVDPGNMGYAQIPAGAIVTVELIPDYGYQVLRAELNGCEIAPTEEQSVFKFTMPANSLHLSAVFTSCEDEVITSADEVKAGSVQLAEGEMNTGSALLTVGSAEDSSETFGKTMEDLAGYEITSCLDIGLQQIFYKGTRDDYWSNSKDTLTSNATIALSLNEAIGTDDVKILHKKHDGEIEIIDATVDETGAVVFKTSSFSTYAIIRAKEGAEGEHSHHDYGYTVTGNILTASCKSTGCTESHSLTLNASNSIFSGSAYDKATLGDTSAWTEAQLVLPDIEYVGRGTEYEESTSAPTNAGTYTAKITVDGTTASVDFEITKATPTVSVAPAKNIGIFSTLATSKELVVDGTASGGSFQYKVDDAATWGDIPTVSTLSLGAHTVYYRIKGDSNYTDLENAAWKIDIEVSSGNITVANTDTITAPAGVTTNATSATSTNLEEVVAILDNIENGKTVSIKLNVGAKDPETVVSKATMEDKAAEVLGSALTNIEYLDIKLGRSVNDVASGNVTDTTKPLEIAISYVVSSDKVYTIIREHDGVITAFVQLGVKPTSYFVDGTFYVDSSTNTIYIYSRYFSDYMIGSVPAHSVIYDTNGGNNIVSSVVAHDSPHVAGDIWLYDHTLSREGNKLRHKACIICGEAMNYEIVNDDNVTVVSNIVSLTTPAPVQPSAEAQYVVVNGDCMSAIARKNGMTLNELINLNPQIANPSLIYPGYVIKVKAALASLTPSSETQTNSGDVVDYIVKAGEWMFKIAMDNGMSYDELCALNSQIKTPSLIYPGDILKIKRR